jgi:hypothetical protein
MKLGLAFKIFFRTLSSPETADAVADLLAQPRPALPAQEKPAPTTKPAEPAKPVRSEALTLLATLQREARLIDFLQEQLDDYSDDQIGAAVRDIHRDSAAVLERLYAPRPASEHGEGESITLESGFSATRYRLIGKVEGEGPFSGSVTHQGWEATKSETPSWQGHPSDARVLAPVEVEVK